MNRQLIVRPEAEADLANAAVWYDSREPGFGLELVSEVHSAILRALKNPESFTRVRQNTTVRRVLNRRFPYRLFFIVRLT
jgi:toxin ParE1/3/4